MNHDEIRALIAAREVEITAMLAQQRAELFAELPATDGLEEAFEEAAAEFAEARSRYRAEREWLAGELDRRGEKFAAAFSEVMRKAAELPEDAWTSPSVALTAEQADIMAKLKTTVAGQREAIERQWEQT